MPYILFHKSVFIGFGKQVTQGWKPQIWTVDCPTDTVWTLQICHLLQIPLI